MTGWLQAIGNFFGALREGLGFARDRHAANNAPDMKANAAARTDQQIRDEATQAVAKGDLAEVRKQAAE